MDLGLFNLMEDFIVNEVDSQDIQTSPRARRRIRRNLSKELGSYLNQEEQTGYDFYDSDESYIEYESPRKKYKLDKQTNFIQRHVDICIGIAYICVLFTFYGTTIYLIHTYSICNNYY